MPDLNLLTIPTRAELDVLASHTPVHTYSPADVTRFLRALRTRYPDSRLVTSTPVDLIETSCHTHTRVRIQGHIAILEHPDQPTDTVHYLLHLLGGPTGSEGFSLTDDYRFEHASHAGWSACAGTPGRLNACYVTPDSMTRVVHDFLHAYLQGPIVTFPPPFTTEERQRHREAVRLQFLSELRRSRDQLTASDSSQLN